MPSLSKAHEDALVGLIGKPMAYPRESPQALMAYPTLPQTWQGPAGATYLAECRAALDAAVRAGMATRCDRIEKDGVSGSAYVLASEATVVVLGHVHGSGVVHVALYRNPKAMLAALGA